MGLGPSIAGAFALIALAGATTAGLSGYFQRIGIERRSVAVSAALAVLAVLPAELGRSVADVRIGAAMTAALALPGLLWLRRSPGEKIGTAASAAVAAAVLGLLAWCALTTHLWDERSTHTGVSAAIARGALPPVHPQFPDAPFRYHVGFDVLVGLVRAFTGAPLDRCIDVVTLACAAVLVWSLHDVGFDLGGKRGALLTPAVALFGYGPLSLCLDVVYGLEPSCSAWFPPSWHHPVYVPPPVVSNFFQHPQGLGMPVALATLRLTLDEDRRRFTVGAGLLALLSQCHIVFFGLVGLATAVIVAVRAVHRRALLGGLARGGVLALVLALAAWLGGFLATPEVPARFISGGHFQVAFPLGFPAVFAMNALVLGTILVALPWGAWRAWQGSPLHGALLVGSVVGLVVGNVVSYERSWDIVKFFGVSAFFANLLLVDALAFLAERRTALAAAASVVVCLAGCAWLLRFGPLNGVLAPPYTERGPDAVAVALDAKAGSRIGLSLVLTSHSELHELGFGVAGYDWRRASSSYLVDRERRDRLTALRQRALATMAEEDVAATGARFVFLSESELRALPVGSTRWLDRVTDIDASGSRFTLFEVPR